MKRIIHTFTLKSFLAGLCFLSVTASPSHAEDGWNFMLGAGVYTENVYTGSDDTYVAPGLLAQATYSWRDLGFFLALHEGAGVVYTNEEYGFIGKVDAVFEQERNNNTYSVFGRKEDHSAETRRLLDGTPTVTTDIATRFSLEAMTRFGAIGASGAYHPTSVDYKLAGQADENLDGWLYTLFYSTEYRLTDRLSVTAMLELTYMNRDYAEAWFSVNYPTPALSVFDAQKGFRDIALSFQATQMFSDQTGLSLVLASTYLLEDAADSPYTVDCFQPKAMLYVFYAF